VQGIKNVGGARKHKRDWRKWEEVKNVSMSSVDLFPSEIGENYFLK
jgi:hypothetical protein